MRILLTNDDGIFAPGLRALREELKTMGAVTVVAPATEQSATGHSVTLLTPLLVNEVFEDLGQGREFIGWAVEGRPADCVKLALLELLPEPPDLLVSGMNAGSNAGINVLYSGTVAAAIEGAFYHQTAIACSLEYEKKIYDYAKGAKYCASVIRQILARPRRPGMLFNINIPVLEKGPIRGVQVLPQNVTPYLEKFDRRINPRGRTYFWTSPEFHCPSPHPDTDVTALAEQYITITPLKFDLTDHAALPELAAEPWQVDLA